MSQPIPMRGASAIALLMLFASIAVAQAPTTPAKPSAAVPAGSSLPTAQPTNASATQAPTAPEPVASHVSVEFADGKLDVDATNASLNEILREVSQKAAIKVTGGVADERVFGHYGPSSAAVVLASLLDGTGSNMLLVDDAKGRSELILTPRRGGATPPNPNAAAQARDNDDQSGNAPRYVPPVRPFQPPVYSGRGPVRSNPDGSPATGPLPPGSSPDPNQPGDGSQVQPPQ